MKITLSIKDTVTTDEVLNLYNANNWSAAKKPKQLLMALNNSHSLITARLSGELIGLGNAISDGHLVVYYPHLLVHPDHQRKGIGRDMMNTLKEKYAGFHQHMLTADADAIAFYKSLGFEKAGNTESMWIYEGNEH